MAGSLNEESLFSLELVVDKLTLPGVQCRFPAVAFRLLDFPTLVIYHVEPELGDAIRSKIKSDPYAKVGGQIPELLDSNGAFAMKKGKSCLLKISADMLLQHLSSTPLYVMMLDTYPDVPKMVGNCIVPLDRTMETLYDKICKDGLAMPVVHGEKGIYKIYNLMGTEIGGIVLGFRLLSLGVALIPHLPAASVSKMQKKNKPESFLLDKKEKDKIQEKVAEIILEDLEQPVTHEVLSFAAPKPQLDGVRHFHKETQYRNDTIQNMATQTQEKVTKVKQKKMANELDIESNLHNIVDDIYVTNTVCPPPLFFNSDMEATSHSVGLEFYEDMLAAEVGQAKIDSASDDDTIRPEDNFSETEPAVQFKPKRMKGTDNTRLSRKQAFQSRKNEQANNFKKFPLLNALIHEIESIKSSGKSVISPDIQIASPPRYPPQNISPPPVSKKLPSQGRSPSPCRERESVEKYLKRVSTPRHQVRELPSPKTPRKFILDPKKPIKGHKCQEASKGVPKNKSWIRKIPPAFGVTKTKLTYGMTNTQRLRLEKSNPELLATLEKQEEERIHKYKEQRRLAELEKEAAESSKVSRLGDKYKKRSDTGHKKPVPTPRMHHDHQDSELYDETGDQNDKQDEYQDYSDYDDGSYVSAQSQENIDKYIPTTITAAKTHGYEYEESDVEAQNDKFHAFNPGFPPGVSGSSFGDGYSYDFESGQPTQRTDRKDDKAIDAGEALGLRKMVDQYSDHDSERSGQSFKSARSQTPDYMDDTRDTEQDDKHISQIKVSIPPAMKAPKASHYAPAVTNIRSGKRGNLGNSAATVEGSIESTAYISRSQVFGQQSYDSMGSEASAEYQKKESFVKPHSRPRRNTESVSSYNGEDMSPRSGFSQLSKGKEKQEYGSDSFEEDSEFQLPEPKSVHDAKLAPEAKFGYTWGFSS